VSTYDEDTELEFFEEPETIEAPGPRRRRRPPRPGGPHRPAPPPPGAVALARLAGLVALAIIIVVGLVYWVGVGQSKHVEYASYMTSLRAIAQSSAEPGAAFASELGSTNLTLAGLQSKLEQWSLQEQRDYDDALRLRPPGPLQAAQQEALATFQLRAIGLTGLANTLAESGSKPATDVANALAAQAQLLTSSDLVWSELFRLPARDTLTRLGVKGVAPPPSQIVTNPDAISARSFALVFGRLRSTNTGGKVTGLHGESLVKTEAVAGNNVKQLSTSSPTTVDVAANLAFAVTFTDAGNFQEVHVPVKLTVTVFGRTVLTKTKLVRSIQPQQTLTVSFRNLNLPTSAFGNNARVGVQIVKVPGEVNLTDNSASYPVFFSLSSGG
jgi:hypothetical protein